jgi:hypothetical protein
MQLFVDVATDPTNVYSSIQFLDSFNNGLGGLAVNSYTSEYPATPVLQLVGGGYYNGSPVSIGFNNGEIDLWKPTNFKANANFSGSVNVHSGSYNGKAINNITPVSSSQAAVQNIVTLTASEYALITPVATTLYIVI